MDSSAQQDFDKLLKAVKLVWRMYATMTTPYCWKTVELRSARSTRRPYNEYALVCKHPDGDPDDDRHGPVAGFPLPQDFPRFVLPEEVGGCDLRDLALNWNRCDSSLTVMWPVVVALLKGHIQEGACEWVNLKIQPRLAGFCRCDCDDESCMFNSEPARISTHSVMVITRNDGERWVIDLTGALFGFNRPFMPEDEYHDEHVTQVVSVFREGDEELDFCLRRSNLSIWKFLETEEVRGRMLVDWPNIWLRDTVVGVVEKWLGVLEPGGITLMTFWGLRDGLVWELKRKREEFNDFVYAPKPFLVEDTELDITMV